MKVSHRLVILWAILGLILWAVGDRVLRIHWSHEAESRLASCCEAVRFTMESRNWASPPESDQHWNLMERQLGIDVVPRDAPSTPKASEILWMGNPARATKVISARLGDSDQESTFRVTLQPEPSPVRQMWLVSNATLWILGCVVIVFVVGTSKKQAKIQQLVLRPWVRAVQLSEGKEFELPPIEQQDSDFVDSLTFVAEQVNMNLRELRSENERSQLVLGNLQEGVLAVDDRLQVLLANRALRQIFDVEDHAYLYRPLLEVIRFLPLTQIVRGVIGSEASREETAELATKSRSLRLLARPLRLDNGRTGALVAVRDETLLKKIESVRRDFVANASHELKTPLAAIRAYAETLQLGALDDREAAERFVGDIVASSRSY